MFEGTGVGGSGVVGDRLSVSSLLWLPNQIHDVIEKILERLHVSKAEKRGSISSLELLQQLDKINKYIFNVKSTLSGTLCL